MSDTVRSLSTSGLTPKKQIQTWSDALTDLCGQFDIDPLEASSLEARINYTTVSQLKLCQIEASQHRIAHTVCNFVAKCPLPDRSQIDQFRRASPRTELRHTRSV